MHDLFGLVGLIILIVLGAAVLLFEIFMFLDLLKNRRMTDTEKIIWAVGMLAIHPFVALAYYFMGHSRLPK